MLNESKVDVLALLVFILCFVMGGDNVIGDE